MFLNLSHNIGKKKPNGTNKSIFKQALMKSETTQIYAKVTDDKIDADTKALNRKISERFSVVI